MDEERSSFVAGLTENRAKEEDGSPLLSVQLRELSNNMKNVYYSTPSFMVQHENMVASSTCYPEPEEDGSSLLSVQLRELSNSLKNLYYSTPSFMVQHENTFASSTCYPEPENSLAQECLRFINTASKEELKGVKGIGEKKASHILSLRPFKQLDDLENIGLSVKKIKKALGI